MTAPIALDAWYATDEDVLVLADGDFSAVVPADTVAAYGRDGVIGADSFTLTSTSNDFLAQGVVSNMVVELLEASAGLSGSGIRMAVDSATADAIVLRRPGKPVGWGQPPLRAGATAIEFRIATLGGIMEDVAYKLHQRYGVDANFIQRAPEDIYDMRVFKRVTVYETLLRRYISLNRTKAGDFSEKIRHYANSVEEELAAITLRWGPIGDANPPTTGQVRFGR